MPLYEYKCECGALRGFIRPIDDRDKPVICDCGKEMVRMVSQTGEPIFKCQGFYKTDYAESNKKQNS